MAPWLAIKSILIQIYYQSNQTYKKDYPVSIATGRFGQVFEF
jgi:hypothetical protein